MSDSYQVGLLLLLLVIVLLWDVVYSQHLVSGSKSRNPIHVSRVQDPRHLSNPSKKQDSPRKAGSHTKK